MRRPFVLALVLLAALALPGPGVAASSSRSGASSAAASTAVSKQKTTKPLEGIDVSHWQGTIDWSRVAGARIAFAFAKATEGQTYSDPTYTSNRSGAAAAHVTWGAYHFARPDTSANDALIEADHFVDTAALHAGDLVPALDLEDAGGLSSADLTTWVRTWLERVRSRTGAAPLIYTNASFWRNRMADTTWFADNGYRLWIANWGVSTPTVPGSNWGGRGWTFWQYTDSGSVPGVSGGVDRDRANGTSLTGVTL